MNNPQINKFGTKRWFNENQLIHRTDGPAVENENDNYKAWCLNGEYHRPDGPAIIYSNGTKMWLQNGKLHRLDGPAVEWYDGNKEFWIDGKKLTEQEFMTKFQNLNIQTEEIL